MYYNYTITTTISNNEYMTIKIKVSIIYLRHQTDRVDIFQ